VRELWLLDDARTYGGGQRSALRLARFVGESLADCSVQVVCPDRSELAERCRDAGVPIMHATFPDLDLLTVLPIMRSTRHLRRVLRKAPKGTILVGLSLRAQVYAHAALFGLRRTPRVVHFMAEQDSASRLTTRLLLRRYGAVVVVGDNAARAYCEQVPGLPVCTVNNFLSPDELSRVGRTCWPPSDGRRPCLGVLARLIPEKGVLELVEELAENPEGWSQLLVGGDRQDEQYVAALENRIAELGLSERVLLRGRVDDLEAFFTNIDALVVPSIGKEGQPTVILEALSYCRPAIVREPIWSDAFAGLPVLPYRDADSLRRILADSAPMKVTSALLLARFSPMHLLEAIEAAAATRPTH
jgi:glycosyltransferase involved in cell wall biosynthesis